MLRWSALAHIKRLKELPNVDDKAINLIDRILNTDISNLRRVEIDSLKDDMKFLQDENTNLSIENAELKYSMHSYEDDREKLSNANNEIYMLMRSIENMKDASRKMQSEVESLARSQEHSK